jgi:beta-mannanase
MDPTTVSVAAIASGRYDGYLSAYAEAVRAYHHPVIISFGHEMNGDWYPWGYKKTSPAVFVAAWRHIVDIFRALGAQNVTWLWTVNVIDDTQNGKIPSPAQWWPGNSYVTWVGIDGYYLKPSWQFAPLFGPTISAVRTLTADPILIAETGAVPAAGQPSKISDLFAGIRSYGLLGFVWFDSTNSIGQPFSISGTAAIDAFRKGASTYGRPGS